MFNNIFNNIKEAANTNSNFQANHHFPDGGRTFGTSSSSFTNNNYNDGFPWDQVQKMVNLGLTKNANTCGISINIGIGSATMAVCRSLNVGTGKVQEAIVFDDVNVGCGVIEVLHCLATTRVNTGVGRVGQTIFHSIDDLVNLALDRTRLGKKPAAAAATATAFVASSASTSSSANANTSYTGSYTGSYIGSNIGSYAGSNAGSYAGSNTGSNTGSYAGSYAATATQNQSPPSNNNIAFSAGNAAAYANAGASTASSTSSAPYVPSYASPVPSAPPLDDYITIPEAEIVVEATKVYYP